MKIVHIYMTIKTKNYYLLKREKLYIKAAK